MPNKDTGSPEMERDEFYGAIPVVREATFQLVASRILDLEIDDEEHAGIVIGAARLAVELRARRYCANYGIEEPIGSIDDETLCLCGCGHAIPAERLRPHRHGGRDTLYTSAACRSRVKKRRQRSRRRAHVSPVDDTQNNLVS
jgi:hypothetical protein